jgi:hypothetical protein
MLCSTCEKAVPEGHFQAEGSLTKHRPAKVHCAACSERGHSRSMKVRAVAYFGGKCFDCAGAFQPCVFDFHHLASAFKERAIAELMAGSWEILLKELKKCALLCANCHRIRHHGIRTNLEN